MSSWARRRAFTGDDQHVTVCQHQSFHHKRDREMKPHATIRRQLEGDAPTRHLKIMPRDSNLLCSVQKLHEFHLPLISQLHRAPSMCSTRSPVHTCRRDQEQQFCEYTGTGIRPIFIQNSELIRALAAICSSAFFRASTTSVLVCFEPLLGIEVSVS